MVVIASKFLVQKYNQVDKFTVSTWVKNKFKNHLDTKVFSVENGAFTIEDCNLHQKEFLKDAVYLVFMPFGMDMLDYDTFTEKRFEKIHGTGKKPSSFKDNEKPAKFSLGWYEAIATYGKAMSSLMSSFRKAGKEKKFNVLVMPRSASKFACHVALDQYIGLFHNY